MFKKLLTGLFVNTAWDLSKVDITYNKTTKEATIKFIVDDAQFELVKNELVKKFYKELTIVG